MDARRGLHAGLERGIAGADAPNIASVRVVEKLGMRPVASANPDAPDEPYYAVYREEFRARMAGEGRRKVEAKLDELGLDLLAR